MGKVLKIREVGEPILEKECSTVDIKNINEDILDIIEDLKATLEFGTGLGIAAPQIGVNKRIIVVGAKKEKVKYNGCRRNTNNSNDKSNLEKTIREYRYTI